MHVILIFTECRSDNLFWADWAWGGAVVLKRFLDVLVEMRQRQDHSHVEYLKEITTYVGFQRLDVHLSDLQFGQKSTKESLVNSICLVPGTFRSFLLSPILWLQN